MRDEYDFSDALPAKDVPHLKKLQAEGGGKTRISIMLDNDILARFKQLAKDTGTGYQTLINQTLRASISQEPVTENTLRQIIREELAHYNKPR